MISFANSSEGSRDPSDDPFGSVRKLLLRRVGSEEYDAWFQQVDWSRPSKDTVELRARNAFQRRWIERRYSAVVGEIVGLVFGAKCRVTVVAPSEAPLSESEALERRSRPRWNPALLAEETHASIDGLALESDPLQSRFTFDEFLTSEATLVAHAASMAVAERPGRIYNPLVILGSNGTGKSHLLQALCSLLRERGSTKQLYVRGTSLVAWTSSRPESAPLDAFLDSLRNVDVLYVDDIHLVPAAHELCELLVSNIRERLANSRQVVLSSDRPLSRIEWMQDLAKSFESGISPRLELPDLETRVRILSRRSEERGHRLPRELAYEIAAQIEENLHELDAVVERIATFCREERQPVGIDLARRAIVSLRKPQHRCSLGFRSETILDSIEEWFGVRRADLLSASKVRRVVFARQAGMYLARELTPLPLQEIGELFGGRDHSTVIYGIRRIALRLEVDPELAQCLSLIRDRFERPGRSGRDGGRKSVDDGR
jgi:chromosomal replication initiator protein